MNLLKIPSIAAIALALALPSVAAKATIQETASGLATFDTFIDFSTPTLSVGDAVSTQFAGLTIAPLFTGGQVFYDGCGPNNLSSVTTSANYIDNYGPGCAVNTTDDSFSIKFANALSALSLTGDLFSTPGRVSGLYTINLLLGGVLQDTADFNGEYMGSLTADGVTFDEIQFVEDEPASGELVQFTDLALLDAAAPPPGTPEPASLALLGAGLACLGLGRRRKRA